MLLFQYAFDYLHNPMGYDWHLHFWLKSLFQLNLIREKAGHYGKKGKQKVYRDAVMDVLIKPLPRWFSWPFIKSEAKQWKKAVSSLRQTNLWCFGKLKINMALARRCLHICSHATCGASYVSKRPFCALQWRLDQCGVRAFALYRNRSQKPLSISEFRNICVWFLAFCITLLNQVRVPLFRSSFFSGISHFLVTHLTIYHQSLSCAH